MRHIRVIDQARTLPTDEVTLVALHGWVAALAEAIGVDDQLLPTFGRSEDFARPHIELSDGGFVYAIVERGKEITRQETTEALEVLALTFLDVTATIGSHWETKHRHPAEDARRRMFAKQISLLNFLFPPWAQRRLEEIAHLLDEVGLDPDDAEGIVTLAESPPRVRHPRRFRIYNSARKARRASDMLGLGGDESVLAAAMTFPAGHKRATALRMAAGGVAMMNRNPAATGGQAARMPGGHHFLIVTSRRLLATTVSSVSTNPKELVAEWPLEKVAVIQARPGWAATCIEVQFRDGTKLQLDGARSSGAEELQDIFGP